MQVKISLTIKGFNKPQTQVKIKYTNPQNLSNLAS